MKLKDIFTYSKPMFADKLARVSLIGSMKRANLILLGVSVCCLAFAGITFRHIYRVAYPAPVSWDQIPQEIRDQLPQDIVDQLKPSGQ